MTTPETFKVGDKVRTTKGHDEYFDSHDEGVIEKVDGEHVELCTQIGKTISLDVKWIEAYEGDFNWVYKGKLI